MNSGVSIVMVVALLAVVPIVAYVKSREADKAEEAAAERRARIDPAALYQMDSLRLLTSIRNYLAAIFWVPIVCGILIFIFSR